MVASVVSSSETVERVVITLVISGTGFEVFGDPELIVVSSLTVVKISDVVIEVETKGRVELVVVISSSRVVQTVTISEVVDPIVEVETVVVRSEMTDVFSGTNEVNVEK